MGDAGSVVECTTLAVHDEVVRQVRESLPEEHVLHGLTEFFRILGDPTRVKILHALFISEMCVCDIATLLDVGRSAVSHQLKTLRQSKLVSYRRTGKTVFYRLADEHVRSIVKQALGHITE